MTTTGNPVVDNKPIDLPSDSKIEKLDTAGTTMAEGVDASDLTSCCALCCVICSLYLKVGGGYGGGYGSGYAAARGAGRGARGVGRMMTRACLPVSAELVLHDALTAPALAHQSRR